MRADFWALTNLLAIILGPIIALAIQRRLDQNRENKSRKLRIFKTLMSFRATRLAPDFVQALNMIDVEFTADSERKVREAWKELQDHFSEWGSKPPEQRRRDDAKDIDRSNELLVELLVKMGDALDYHFDRVYIKKSVYYPEGLGSIEQEQHDLRKRLLRLLAGESRLPVALFEQKFEPMNVQRESDGPGDSKDRPS